MKENFNVNNNGLLTLKKKKKKPTTMTSLIKLIKLAQVVYDPTKVVRLV